MGFENSWAGRLDRVLLPVLGPAQVSRIGPPDAVPVAERSCPLCGAPMGAHRIERPGGNVASRLHCP